MVGEGRYLQLNTPMDRSELNGITQAGLPLQISMFWLPATKPEMVETRKLMDGDRYLVVLDESPGNSDDSRVLSVVPGENGAWYVDEVGRMTNADRCGRYADCRPGGNLRQRD